MLAVGEILQNRYRIVREIGAGGMGTVYEGENLLIRRRVAIKVMRADARNSIELCARFEREAQIASQIPSDHITEVLDLGELDSGQRFIVMEYLVGESLAERLTRVTRMHAVELLALVRQALSALGAAHRVGVIHRDVKPDNVFILSEKAGHSDFVKLLDFGISKIPNLPGEHTLTQSGMFVGTPSYMAPEQVSGGAASPLWDLYAMGVIIYRGLTGETPYKSQQLHELVYKVALGNFTPPSERAAGIDPQLDALVCKAMARFPQERFQSAEEFITAIDAWLDGPGREQTAPASRPPPRPPGGTRAMSAGRIPTPGRLPTPGRMPTPPGAGLYGSPSAAVPTTRLTTELGISGRLRASPWRGWAALGLAVFALAVAVSLWRVRAQVDAAVAHDVLAAQPATAAMGASGVSPVPPASAAAPAAAAAPVRTGVEMAAPGAGSAPVIAPVPQHRADREDEGSDDPDDAVADRDAQRKTRAAVALPRSNRRAEAERKRTRAVAAPASKAEAPERNEREPRKERGESSSSRPDWGY